MLADGGDAAQLRATIAKFIVADRVVVEELVPAACVIHISADSIKVGGIPVPESDIICEIPRRRVAQSGVDIVIPDAARLRVSTLCQEHFGAPLSDAEYYHLRWEQCVPVFPDELNDQVILTECGMREAVSFSKGCYVGQEVLERSDAIGKLPRALERVVFQGTDPLEQGSAVSDAQGASIGKIVSSMKSPSSGQIYAFALLRSGTYSAGDRVTCADAVGEVIPRQRG
jgi:folate-binding protein YgfZ